MPSTFFIIESSNPYSLLLSVATSLVHLCKLRDAETQRLALQTLELLAIENSDVIITHVGCASWFSNFYVFNLNTSKSVPGK